MATEEFFGRFLWGPRMEDVSECTCRLQRLLSGLVSVDPLVSSWYVAGQDKAIYRVSGNESRMAELLRMGVNRTDIGSEEMPELGFTVNLWNARKGGETVTLSINCGVYSEWNNNCVTFGFPSKSKKAVDILTAPVLVKLSKMVIESWQPDHGVITSFACSDLLSFEDFFVEIGWITFLSNKKYGAVPPLGKPARIEQANEGCIIVATDEILSCANPVHIANVRSIARVLDLQSRIR